MTDPLNSAVAEAQALEAAGFRAGVRHVCATLLAVLNDNTLTDSDRWERVRAFVDLAPVALEFEEMP